jgi:HNH endonuclease
MALLQEGLTVAQIACRLGVSKPTGGAPLEQIFVNGMERNRYYLKGRLIAQGIEVGACEECGLSAWRGEPLPLELHHVSGDPSDNRIQNLQLLCPNCHAITPNWGGRAKAKRAA